MNVSTIWLSESDVAALVSLKDAISGLEEGLHALDGGGFNIAKALGSFDPASSMHSLGSALPGSGYCGYKNWINTPQGAKAVYILFDARKGGLLAVMEAGMLGKLRTAAMTGLGTKWLAGPEANDMALIGSGRQALAQVAAVHLVRPLSRLRVWSPTPEKRKEFCRAISAQFDFEVIDSGTLREATSGASLVTIVTRAREPFIEAKDLDPGTHLNAVGAILPSNAELHQDVFGRVDFIAVDDVAATRKASRELMDYFDKGAGAGEWTKVRSLGSLIAGNVRPGAGTDLTLFKSMGMGISDLSVAMLAYRRALAQGRGLPVPPSATASMRVK